MTLRQTLAPIIDFAFPPRCPACGDAIAGSADGDDGLCAPCWGMLRLPGHPSCETCQMPFDADDIAAGRQCASCIAAPPEHDGIVAATIYGDVSRELVLGLKHTGRIALAGPMGRTLAARMGNGAGETCLVMPVPLHRWRLWKRGYNQSALIGRSLAKARSWPFAPDGLRRIRATPSLGGLGPEKRREVLRGAIALSRNWEDRIAGRDIVLVDDVLTSGATSDACVSVLKHSGARRVVIACYARAVSDPRVPDLQGRHNALVRAKTRNARDHSIPGVPRD